MENEIKFAKGLFFENPSEKAPDFVKGKVSVKVEDFIEFLQQNKNDKGYVNLDLLQKKDKTGLYFKLNDYKPKENFGGDVVDNVESEKLEIENIPF